MKKLLIATAFVASSASAAHAIECETVDECKSMIADAVAEATTTAYGEGVTYGIEVGKSIAVASDEDLALAYADGHDDGVESVGLDSRLAEQHLKSYGEGVKVGYAQGLDEATEVVVAEINEGLAMVAETHNFPTVSFGDTVTSKVAAYIAGNIYTTGKNHGVWAGEDAAEAAHATVAAKVAEVQADADARISAHQQQMFDAMLLVQNTYQDIQANLDSLVEEGIEEVITEATDEAFDDGFHRGRIIGQDSGFDAAMEEIASVLDDNHANDGNYFRNEGPSFFNRLYAYIRSIQQITKG